MMRIEFGACLLAAVVALASPVPGASEEGPRHASTLDRVRTAGVLRVCMTGDYKPFSFLRPDGRFEGIDVELAEALAASLKANLKIVKTSWSTLMDDFTGGACDMAMGGISITLDRQQRAGFSAMTMVDGKAPIVRCADLAKYGSLAQIDRPGVRAIVNPGGTNERYAREHFKQAEIRVHPDNVTIFDELVSGRADVMVTDQSETMLQHRLRPTLCAVPLDKPLQYAEKAYLLPRDDPAFKAYVDQWLHLAKATGEFDANVDRWLK
jgi:cyclohexadienyl dehydratase